MFEYNLEIETVVKEIALQRPKLITKGQLYVQIAFRVCFNIIDIILTGI